MLFKKKKQLQQRHALGLQNIVQQCFPIYLCILCDKYFEQFYICCLKISFYASYYFAVKTI